MDGNYSPYGTITVAIADPGIFRRRAAEKLFESFFWRHLGVDVLGPTMVHHPLSIRFERSVGELRTIMRFDAQLHPTTTNPKVRATHIRDDGFTAVDTDTWVLAPKSES
jgi:hypothetical protein